MRLIDADTTWDTLEHSGWENNADRDIAENIVLDAPTVDAVPVVHGKWIMTGGMKPPEYHHHHQCSVCEAYAPMRPPYGSREMLTRWCPGCNAKMDLEEQS